jgi:hypothetical protein
VPYKAIVFTAFSLYLVATTPFFTLTWFAYVGLVLVSHARFHKVQHGVPCPELLYLASGSITGKCAAWILTSHTLPALDEILWKFDANFGYPELWLTRLDQHFDLFNKLLAMVYLGLPLAGVIVYLAMPNSTPIRRKYCIASALGGVAIFFYRICPAAGPRYLFGDRFPNSIPLLTHPHARIMQGFLNCAPSGHVAWALILVWFAWRYCGRPMQIGTVLYMLLTSMATLVGEHYFIDLIVAVPFAVALCAVAEKQWKHAAGGVLVLTAWLVALRFQWALAWPMPVVWILSAVTVLTPWWVGKVAIPEFTKLNALRGAGRPIPAAAVPGERELG